jgi:antitoxin component YwqK of YwqJK toxin-antitoxin module
MQFQFIKNRIISLLPVLILIFFSFNMSAQLMRVENAKYFDSNHNLYTGKYEEFYDNGNKKLEMYLNNGELDSVTILYFENGKINELRSYKKGLMHGKWETYNSKSVKLAEAWYRNDKKDGIWRIWDENGTLRYEMPYSNGIKIDTWKIFNEKGELIDQKKFD